MSVLSRESESGYRIGNALAKSDSGSCLVDPETRRVTAIDSRLAEWLGREAGVSISLGLAEIMPGLSGEQHPQQTTVVCQERADFQAEVSFTSLIGPEDNHLLVTIQPLVGQIEKTLFIDALTGLPDRRELANQWARWHELGANKPTAHAVLFLDLDGFKQINDSHGHAIGDRVLQSLATRWQSCIRECDLLARYGGDEFIVLLAGVRSEQELEPIIARLVATTIEPIEIEGLNLNVAVTIGIALAEDTSVDLDQLLAEADRDMYAKKRL